MVSWLDGRGKEKESDAYKLRLGQRIQEMRILKMMKELIIT